MRKPKPKLTKRERILWNNFVKYYYPKLYMYGIWFKNASDTDGNPDVLFFNSPADADALVAHWLDWICE